MVWSERAHGTPFGSVYFETGNELSRSQRLGDSSVRVPLRARSRGYELVEVNKFTPSNAIRLMRRRHRPRLRRPDAPSGQSPHRRRQRREVLPARSGPRRGLPSFRRSSPARAVAGHRFCYTLAQKYAVLGGARRSAGRNGCSPRRPFARVPESLPAADETITPDGHGRISLFENGALVWYPYEGVRDSTSRIVAAHRAAGRGSNPRPPA
jgi:hypothetical protein